MKNSGFYLDLKNLKNSLLGYKRTEIGIEKSLNVADESLYLSSAYMAGAMYSTAEGMMCKYKIISKDIITLCLF